MKRCFSLCLAAAMISLAHAQYDPTGRPNSGGNQRFTEDAPWQEAAEVVLPAFPEERDLVPIYVSAVATNTYLIDTRSLAIGSDGVVRYTLVVQAAGGAQNISHEGMHCKEGRWKTYATGRSDSTWSRARISEWRPIENKPVNRHHAALSREYFCPLGNPVDSADEARNVLRQTKKSTY